MNQVTKSAKVAITQYFGRVPLVQSYDSVFPNQPITKSLLNIRYLDHLFKTTNNLNNNNLKYFLILSGFILRSCFSKNTIKEVGFQGKCQNEKNIFWL